MASFTQNILCLTAEEALAGLHAWLHQQKGARPNASSASPVRTGQIYETVASKALAEHCLDQQGVSAFLGWPTEDVLHNYRQSHVQPEENVMLLLIKAINSDESMEMIEYLLSREPLLAYRFLRYTNSAGLGLRHEIDALRQGLMVLGLSRTKSWLQEQLPHASTNLNLQPIRIAMVLRAQFMANLLDSGAGDALSREIYLCGLLSQIDSLLGEPLPQALTSIPLPERVSAAILRQNGPYFPYLEVAASLETPHTQITRDLCEKHELNIEDVNVALLRTLASLSQS
jgi:c-di-GMP-related signal transduction protein